MKKLYRDRFDKKIGGVCGGLAQYFQFDSSLIRLIALLLTVCSLGVFLLVYLLLWAILPLGPRAYIEASYRRLYRSKIDRKLAGVCGGLGAYFRVDPNILRLIILVLTFFTSFIPILIVYVVTAIVIPEEP